MANSFASFAEDKVLFRWLQNVKAMGGGHFLSSLADAAFRADSENQRILYPAMLELMEKYPRYHNCKCNRGSIKIHDDCNALVHKS